MGSEEKKKQKKMKKNGNRKGKEETPEMITDDRFAAAQTDPRFMEAPKKRSKVLIDSRFRHVFTDKSFSSSNAPVDKRGKPRNNKKGAASLSHYYRLAQPEVGDEVSRVKKKEDGGDVESEEIGNQSESESESEIEKLNEGESEIKKLNEALEDDEDDDDLQSLDDSSSTSTDSDDQYIDEEEEEDTLLQPEENVPDIDEETRRLAVVNLDWSQVRAVDLYVLLSSFLPKGGQVVSVSVYPSEFGLKRMEEEAIRGPVGLFDDEDNQDDEDDDDDEIDKNKLRAYEISRLRYYYAVVECDSIATANHLYKSCDGVEFERSANKLDLRFIPDSMECKHQPRDVATEAPADYEGLDFQTRALQHSNIQLTWDEDEPQRVKTLKRKLNDEQIAELELKEFLASDESESEEDNEDGVEDKSAKKCKKRDKYRALIQSAGDGSDEDGEDDNGQDMEVTFSTGLEDISKRILEKKNKKSETVWEAYLRKRREKKKASKKGSKNWSEDESSDTDDEEPAEEPDDFFVEEAVQRKKKKPSLEKVQESEASRAELELLTADDKGEDTNVKGYNLKTKKKKGKKGKGVPDDEKIPAADLDDPRFSAIFNSPLFALDPTDPQFKRSAAYARQIAQKKKTSTQRRDS